MNRTRIIVIAVVTLLFVGLVVGAAGLFVQSTPAGLMAIEPSLNRDIQNLQSPRTEEYLLAEEAESRPDRDSARPHAPLPAPTAPPPPAAGGSSIPNDQPYDLMFFESDGVNPFVDTEDDHLSTFAMDVDTAAYSVARRYIIDGHLPPHDAIRVEEFINYFDLDYPLPEEDTFAIHLEGAPAPFGPENSYLLKVGLQGKEVAPDERKDANLTFVIDVSGSMDRENRLGLVKRALRLLVDELRPADSVSLVVYGSTAQVILEPTPADRREIILSAIDELQPGGSTNAEAGLLVGYKMAMQSFTPGAINRVILLSDGVANVGNTGPDSILETIRGYVSEGVTLSTVGVGMGNYNDVLMEQLANDGNGSYAYVDTLDEAKRIFVENLTGTLQVIAKDAKIQVEFNPELVRSYRLLGYENRDVADEAFRQDDVDAGEVGAGHSVTALYELKLHNPAESHFEEESAVITYIRYQEIDTGDVIEQSKAFSPADFRVNLSETSDGFRLIAAVGEYAEILRGSYWAKDGTLLAVEEVALTADDSFAADPDVTEFLSLLQRANTLLDTEPNP